MGEEKKKEKPSKADGGDNKKDAAAEAIVLKVDLHCAGCASKVKRAIKHAPGVESVKTDTAANKVVVTGAADAAELKERIEARAKKPVQIVSAGAGPPKKEKEKAKENEKEKRADGGEKKPEKEKGKPEKEKKAEAAADKPKEEEKKPKEPKEETVTLKIRLHCEGCIDRIMRRINKIKGVKDVQVDKAKDLVKVTGTMDAAALPGYLRDKLSRPVEVVAPGKKDGGDKKDEGEKKKDKGAGDGGENKKDGGGGGDDKKDKSAAASASVAPMPMADASMYQMPPQYGYHMPYNAPAAPGGYYGAAAPPPNPPFYPNAGPYYPPPPYASYPAHAPQMFSDENPNACSVM